jgi:hypothetical protein
MCVDRPLPLNCLRRADPQLALASFRLPFEKDFVITHFITPHMAVIIQAKQ